jgi:signal transduction histidine kinase
MTVDPAIGPATTPAIRRHSAIRVLVVTAVYVTAVIAAGIYPLVSPLRYAGPITVEGQLMSIVNGAAWLAVLLITMVRQPEGRLWKLIFVWSIASRIYFFSYVPNSLVWTVARPIEVLGIAVYAHLAIAYPTGYLRSRFDRIVVTYIYVLLVAPALLAHPFWEVTVGCVPDCVRNLVAIWPDERIFQLITNGSMVFAVITAAPLILTALWRHWRDASPAGRRALLPVVVAFPIEVALGAADAFVGAIGYQPGIEFFNGPSGTALRLVVPLILPIGLLLTFLRPRLNRGRMAALVVELGRGVPLGGLRDVLARALGDPSLQLAFAAPSGSGYVDAAGQPVELPANSPTRMVTRLERGDELLGVLVHDPLLEVEDPGLVEAVGNAARLALENERLAAEVRAQLEEVRASRSRIVEAADAERRRVERDLHDGAQQRLVALAMRLQVAKQQTPEASTLLDEATTELETAIGEVRGLARGVHPTILTESGLAAAIDALAERTPIPVIADVVDRRFDGTIEATAYFVVAEALTNVVRYSGAREARVIVHEAGDRVVVEVADDGRGGADPTAGSGLRGLDDRIAAIGGRLSVTSPAGSGTTIRAELPVDVSTNPATPIVERPFPDEPVAAASPPVRAVPAAAPAPPAARVGGLSPVVLIVALTGALVALALAAGVLGSRSYLVDGRAEAFARPFVFQVPSDSQIVVDAKSKDLNVLSVLRNSQGISIWNVGHVVVDNCSWEPDSPTTTRRPGVDGLLAYLRSVPRLRVKDLGTLAVDGRPAHRVDLTVEDQDTKCADDFSLILWRAEGLVQDEGNAVGIQVPEKSHVLLTMVDVDGATIAIEVWTGDPQAQERWFATAQRIVDSIRFLHAPAAVNSPAAP